MTGIAITGDQMIIHDSEGRPRIVTGCLSDAEVMDREPPEPLTPEEEIYGRGLYSLPEGWEDLSGDERWLHHLSDELRNMWPHFSREQKMAIAYSVNEMVDDMFDLECSLRER
ncbi:hypothetical protein FNI16_14025 [Salmonella enterica subsp. diarizonae]|uniref:Uncharacterized protein n=3 Tax=Salmonella enterica TaxID=28901 RepID=A0A505CRY4_SALER|nr:hypothetical protein [Salmonella enterica]AXC69605.1 hypothetical protein DOE63_32055 [Salmonella enterica subsp. diarizonae serovar 59:z10:-]EAA9297702.1 hypothetical protein [Salmonella enterica subsp. enterica serovar Enteritidis]EBQ4836128.1 hypothetical protein [Salmonella enterica subsp. arizonae]ECD6312667.1 hypothetical protein [Salmonella enterica subsp. enterica serovar Newport]ECH9564604.1 hypothetical protein [Salmonella enterica subsp. salamae]ECI8027642.1 hypothetical protein